MAVIAGVGTAALFVQVALAAAGFSGKIPVWKPIGWGTAGLDERDPVAQFAAELRALRRAAGNPTLQMLIHQASFQDPPVVLTKSSLSAWFNGISVPKAGRQVRFVLTFLHDRAKGLGRQMPAVIDYERLRRAAWAHTHADRGGRPPGPPTLEVQERRRAATEKPEMRDLVSLLVAVRGDARGVSGDLAPSPHDNLHDLTTFLQKVADNARAAQLPRFLAGTGGLALSRQAVVREGVRKSGTQPQSTADLDGRRAYLLPVDYAGYRLDGYGAARPWLDLADRLHQVVVLSDPGLGKSWLVRTESFRCATAALSRLEGDVPIADVVLPVPMRCDQLARARGETLGQAAAEHFARLGWISARSQQILVDQIDSGNARLLLDAYDELPDADARIRLEELLGAWASGGPDRRWLLTSRIAGYAGPPVSGAAEVELQALSPDDVINFIRAWGLRQDSQDRVLAMVVDPAVAGMARIPLLLAMLCSLASHSPADQELPKTRTALYDRMLRWYLEHPHRSPAFSRDAFGTETVLEILSKVAYAFAVEEGGWRDLLPKEMLVEAVRGAGRPFDDLRIGAEAFINEIAVRTGLLVPEGDVSEGRNPRYLFLHRTFAEYLTARYLASPGRTGRLEVIEGHLWFDPEWAQVIPMIGGRLASRSDARQLLRFLTSRTDDVLSQARLTAVGVLSEREDRETLLMPGEAHDFACTIIETLRTGLSRERAVLMLASAANLTTALMQGLIHALDAGSDDLRIAAMRILRGRAAADVPGRALEFLEQDNAEVRKHAVELLAGYKEPRVFQALLKRLADNNGGVQSAAAAALARFAVPDLLDALRSASAATAPAVREGLLQALAAAPEAVPLEPFTDGLGDEYLVRMAAVKALEQRADPSVTQALLERLDDSEENFRRAIIEALASHNCKDSAFINAYLAELDDNRTYVGWMINPVVVAPMPGALAAGLITRLSSRDASIRRLAARVLATARPRGCEHDLLRLLDAESPEVREAAAAASGGRQEPALVARLTDSLGDNKAPVRRAALQALVASGTRRVADHLVTLLADPEPGVRRAAAEASEGRQAPGLTEALVKRVLEDDKVGAVDAAVRSLRGREGPGVDDALHSALNRSDLALDEFLFEPAASQLNSKDPAAVLEALRPYLEGSNPYTQRAAARALTSCTAPGTVEALITVIANGTRKGRISAWWALAGRPLEADLVTIAARIPEMKGKAKLDLLTAALHLAERRYLHLSSDERAHVRSVLTASSSNLNVGD